MTFAGFVCQLWFSAFLAIATTLPASSAEFFDTTAGTVGRNTNGLETPVNQRITPAGTLVELPRMRPQALALSPDGQLLVTAGLTAP